MKTFWASLALLLAILGGVAAPPPGPTPFESFASLEPANRIDELVFDRLRELNIRPARLCSDPVFVRRAYLDVIGTLPSATEARTFLLDRNPHKRRKLIDQLLEREEYADYWAMHWSDLLRIKAEFPINLWPNAVQAYHRYVRTSLKANKPYDQFARELLTASGSNFRVPQVNFYRAAQNKDATTLAKAVALVFLGARADKWPPKQLAGLAAFFAQVNYKSTDEWKEEIVFFDPDKDTNHLARAARFPDGTPAHLTPGQDPRQALADWLISPKNPWFNRNIVNRIWAWLLGRGIIHEPDDIRPDNPPVNAKLLAYLEQELVSGHYDLKHIYRLILNSKTYQLASIPRSTDPAAEANFAYYPLRRLEAEVLIDALCQITGSTEKYSSPIPEPYTFIPEDQRSIALADGSITSSFLELFGRPPRDTGLMSERNNRPSAAQRLHLLNSSHIQRKIERSQMVKYQSQAKKTPREIANGIYLGILSRFPTQREVKAVTDYAQDKRLKKRDVVVDLAWALINSSEFQYRH